MTPTPNAFVAGATGYTGRAVVETLCRNGVRTIAHVRPGASGAAEWRARFEAMGAVVAATPWEPEAMRAALALHRPGYVFALLGTTRRRAASEQLADPYERIDYGLTAMLRDAAVACGTCPRFIYLSAFGAKESSANKYLAVRGRMERELREGQLPWLVAQPLFVTGSDRTESRPAERFYSNTFDAVLRALSWVGFGALRDRYASLSGTVLARGLVAHALADRDGRHVVGVSQLRAGGTWSGR